MGRKSVLKPQIFWNRPGIWTIMLKLWKLSPENWRILGQILASKNNLSEIKNLLALISEHAFKNDIPYREPNSPGHPLRGRWPSLPRCTLLGGGLLFYLYRSRSPTALSRRLQPTFVFAQVLVYRNFSEDVIVIFQLKAMGKRTPEMLYQGQFWSLPISAAQMKKNQNLRNQTNRKRKKKKPKKADFFITSSWLQFA